jgi:excisionase family DNA binding protein
MVKKPRDARLIRFHPPPAKVTRSSIDTPLEPPVTSKSRRGTLTADGSDILTVDEAATMVRVNRKTLYEFIRLSQPQWAIRLGRTIRVSRSALLEAFRGNRDAALGESK